MLYLAIWMLVFEFSTELNCTDGVNIIACCSFLLVVGLCSWMILCNPFSLPFPFFVIVNIENSVHFRF